MNFDTKELKWIREPKQYVIQDQFITITTEPHTDLWQRTYYGFQNDNAPVLVMKSNEKYFSFIVKTEFVYKGPYDQCGLAIYLDSENWVKASIEYENEEFQRLGSVVTNHGYSDWATTDIDSSIHSMWYRLSRRESDYLIESSTDGINFKQMRIFHLWNGSGEIQFGVYACSPENSSFEAIFAHMELTECKWLAHQ